MPTDLPEPVVPATSRCGMRARSAITGSPLIDLPSAERQRRVSGAESLGFEHLAQQHGSRAARSATRCRWRCGPARRRRGRSRAHRAGDVVGEPDDARRLRAACRLQLEQRHDRAGLDVLDLALDAEVGEHVLEQPRVAAQHRLGELGTLLGGRRPLQHVERRPPPLGRRGRAPELPRSPFVALGGGVGAGGGVACLCTDGGGIGRTMPAEAGAKRAAMAALEASIWSSNSKPSPNSSEAWSGSPLCAPKSGGVGSV